MANHMHLYMNNPTAGNSDGTAVSTGTNATPILGALTVDDTNGAATAIKCAVRCESGYTTSGTVTLKTVTDSNGSYVDYTGTNVQIAADNNYADSAAALAGATWANTLTISTAIGATNTIFWVKMAAAAGENPARDTSVKIYSNATVVTA